MSGGCQKDVRWISGLQVCFCGLFLLISLISLVLRSRCVGYFLSNNFALFSSIFLAARGIGAKYKKARTGYLLILNP